MQPHWLGRVWQHLPMDYPQEKARALVAEMLSVTGLEPTQLARKAGVTPSTLTRFLNKPVKHTLSVRTLLKLSAASGIAVPMGGEVVQPGQEIVHDPAEIRWLKLWRRMPKPTKAVALDFFQTLLPSEPETDDFTHPTITPL